MARVTENGISGLVGPVVFYSVNGKNYVRSQPRSRKKKRGEPENPLNTIFGLVSKYGSGMIKRMKNSFLFPFNRNTYNMLRGWLRNQYATHRDDASWETAARINTMCQLNPETDLRDFFGAGITVNDNSGGLISVLIPAMTPAQDLKAPLRTKKVNMKTIVVTSPFRITGISNNFCMEQYNFDYSKSFIPAKEVILDTRSVAGDIAIVVIALEFETTDTGKGVYNTDKHWLPAAIIAMGRLK